MQPRFIVDNNVGKLAKWLRMMGYDAILFDEKDDGEMVKVALSQGRVILTKDTQFMKRRVITTGKVRAVLIEDDNPKAQLSYVVSMLDLDYHFRPFSLCLECNQELVERTKEEVRNLVPPYVFKTQNQYMECPSCRRIYWRGTHWQAMSKKLEQFMTEGVNS